MNKIVFGIICLVYMSSCVQASTQEVVVYNLNVFQIVMNPVKIYQGSLIIGGEFVDGAYEDGSYKGRPVFISNCQDFHRYDLREITGIVHTDRQLLIQRKMSCVLLSKIKKANRITFIQREGEKVITEISKHQQRLLLKLFKYPLDSKPKYSLDSSFFENGNERLFFSKIMKMNETLFFSVDLSLTDSNRQRRYFLVKVLIENGEEKAIKEEFLK